MMLEIVLETFELEVIVVDALADEVTVCVTVGPATVEVAVVVVLVAGFKRYPAAPPMTRPPTAAAAATAPVLIACLLDNRLLRKSGSV
jgi:hypothetical protein